MEIEKNNEYKDFKQSDLYKYRRFQNAKMEIYQYSNEPLIRPKTVIQDYEGSYEQKLLLDNCYNKLSNSSHLIYFSLSEEKPINFIRHKIRKIFHAKEILNKEYLKENLEMQYINFSKKLKFEKIQNEREYKELCQFINNPSFDMIMKTKVNIARWILNHEYLPYHPDYEMIKKTYSIVLCPSYKYEPEENNEYASDSNSDVDSHPERGRRNVDSYMSGPEDFDFLEDGDDYNGNNV